MDNQNKSDKNILENIPLIPKSSRFFETITKSLGKAKVAATIVPLLILVAITIAVATISYNFRNKSLSPTAPDSNPNAGSAACTLNLSINTPIPSRTPTPTPSNICKVELDLQDTAVCWPEPRTNVPVGYKIVSLPSTGGPFYLQTDWYIVKPELGPHHYKNVGPISVGQTGVIYGDWPGVSPNQTDISENHYGINVVDSRGNPIFDSCSDGMDYYWTPYVSCPGPTVTPTPKPTRTPRPTATPTPAPQCSREWCINTYDLVPRTGN